MATIIIIIIIIIIIVMIVITIMIAVITIRMETDKYFKVSKQVVTNNCLYKCIDTHEYNYILIQINLSC